MIGSSLQRPSPRRAAVRATMSQIDEFSGTNGGYQAAKKNRLTKFHAGSNISENSIPREEIARLRWASWELYRNNPHARKIVRTLEAKVIGRGMQPASQAIEKDGRPHVKFRSWAQDLWLRIGRKFDVRGEPGRGGQHLVDLQKTAFRSVILGGDTLYSLRFYKKERKEEMGLLVPLQLQLIHPERLGGGHERHEAPKNHRVIGGVEVRPDGSRAAYWILDAHPSEGIGEARRVPAAQIGHLYAADDIDQIRGVPWFAPALMEMRDTGDYQYNELKSSAIASCVALAVKLPRGNTFGVDPPEGYDLTDEDGNDLTFMQPGMVFKVPENGGIEGFNPARPTTNAEAWIQHMIRSTAGAVPGVKASTLTGDYRNSSFSSERSADNDIWPELYSLQDWFAAGFNQPIYEEVIKAAVLDGYFKGVITENEFADREDDFLAANWQGPVALSINPVDDAEASKKLIQGGNSSVQIECGRRGFDWRAVLADNKEFIEYATQIKLPEIFIYQMLGLDPALIQQEEQDVEAVA